MNNKFNSEKKIYLFKTMRELQNCEYYNDIEYLDCSNQNLGFSKKTFEWIIFLRNVR